MTKYNTEWARQLKLMSTKLNLSLRARCAYYSNLDDGVEIQSFAVTIAPPHEERTGDAKPFHHGEGDELDRQNLAHVLRVLCCQTAEPAD